MVAFSFGKRRAFKSERLFRPPKPFVSAGDLTALHRCRFFDPLATQEMQPAAGVSRRRNRP
jgi:hypothetical protein